MSRAKPTYQSFTHALRAIPIFITVAAFGPYVIGSIRTEQLIVYFLVLCLIPLFLQFNPQRGTPLIAIWSLYVAVGLLGVFFPLEMGHRFLPGDALAGLDNVLLPASIMVIVWSVIPAADAANCLHAVGRIVSLIMVGNSVLAIVSTQIDVSSFLGIFWTNATTEGSVAENAATMGRFSGVFNQPAEAGVMYSVAGLLAVLVWQAKPKLLAGAVLLIITGGLLTVSKIFVLAGLPLILVYWARSQRKHRRGILTFVSVCALGVALLQSGITERWSGLDYLLRIVNPQGGILQFYTAGRLGGDSLMLDIMGEVFRLSPATGVGLAGWRIPYDSAFAEAVIVGGAIGLLLYATCLLLILFFSIGQSDALKWFAISFTLVIWAGSAGLSPLTANRVSSVVWVIISLLVLALPPKPGYRETPRASRELPVRIGL